MMIDTPIYCLTSDIDWASEYCIDDFLKLTKKFRITPTLFATHHSPIIKTFNKTNKNGVGLHPNFRKGSSHGIDYMPVIEKVFNLYPNAKTFRSHSFFDSSDIITEMSNRGIKYDSNLCLYLQPNIVPLKLGAKHITRFPVFWEDDIHWIQTGGDWELDHFVDAFTSPGLKIINVHPFIISANVPTQDYYLKVKKHITTLSKETINDVRHSGAGARTFLINLLKFLTSRKQHFYTLHELYEMFPITNFLALDDKSKGRHTIHSDEEYQKYRKMTDTGKQDFIRKSYDKRNAKDKYATSRDFNVRELEIQLINKNLSTKGTVIDLGCGNGYTLISLAKHLREWDLVGIDFSKNLIEGAKYLLGQERAGLQSIPSFICSDALKHLESISNNSIKYIITERFIQNLPNVNWQKKAIEEIYRVLQKGGKLLMCEGSKTGFNALNDLRKKLGLPSIPATSSDNVSAIRIDDETFENYVRSEIGFKLEGKYGFKQYFIISRIFYPLMVSPLSPRFDSKFSEIARMIQENTDFTAGYGSNHFWVMQK